MSLDPEFAAALAAMPRLPSNGKLLDFTDIPKFRAMMAAVPQPSAAELDDPRVEVDIVPAAADIEREGRPGGRRLHRGAGADPPAGT